VDGGGLGFLDGQEFVERGVDGFGARGEELVQVERCFLAAIKLLPKMPETRASLKGFFLLRGGDYGILTARF
jgi:hypothetical protein